MMRKKLFFLATLACTSLQLFGVEQKVGVVNFSSCIADSKLGKQEQNAFETMRKQLVSLVEDTDKQYRAESEKLQDKDYLDGLSKEGEEALQSKISQLQDELGRYQQQYYQFMNQGQYRIVQSVVQGINTAAEHIASSHGLNLIINKEACFYAAPTLDVTAEIVKEMDNHFDIQSIKQEDAVEKN